MRVCGSVTLLRDGGVSFTSSSVRERERKRELRVTSSPQEVRERDQSFGCPTNVLSGNNGMRTDPKLLHRVPV